MGLFSKKPGGTFFGNLGRSLLQGAQTSVGLPVLVGSGKKVIPANDQYNNGETAVLPGVSVSSSKSLGALASAAPSSDNSLIIYLAVVAAALYLFNKKK